MKISYQRGMQKNFMIVDPQDLDWDGYECRMLLRNNIEGLLRMRMRPTPEGPQFYYDITSRQPLVRMIKGTQWKADEFRAFMINVCGTLTRMQDYLLRESRILFDSEHIYTEPGSGRVFFCYVPGLDRPFSEDLGKLLEELLECVDHRDKECVVLAYGLYQETRKENYGMEDLLRLIYTKNAADEEADPCEYTVDTDEFPMQAPSVMEQRPSGFFERLKDKVFTRFSRAEDDVGVEDDGELWFEGLYEPENAPAHEDEKTEVLMVRESEEREKMSLLAQDTMVLSDIGPNTGIHILRSLDAAVADIPVAYFPFVIGKQESLTDYLLADDTVSRLHVKLEKREERYMIQDLNSTNGTSLNGELLENNEEKEIVPGDVIGIARLRFRFE